MYRNSKIAEASLVPKSMGYSASWRVRISLSWLIHTIIQKWIAREELGSNSNKLYELSADIANYMYQAESTTILADRVDKIALKKHIDLKPIIAKSRSLLNRNSSGEYKFAHRSFLEFFIVDNILRRMVMPDNTNFLWSLSGAKRFFIRTAYLRGCENR